MNDAVRGIMLFGMLQGHSLKRHKVKLQVQLRQLLLICVGLTTRLAVEAGPWARSQSTTRQILPHGGERGASRSRGYNNSYYTEFHDYNRPRRRGRTNNARRDTEGDQIEIEELESRSRDRDRDAPRDRTSRTAIGMYHAIVAHVADLAIATVAARATASQLYTSTTA